MNAAAKLLVKYGLLSKKDYIRLNKVLISFDLPLDIAYERENILNYLKKDKKRDGTYIDFVLIKGIGTVVFKKIPVDDLRGVLNDMH